MEGVATELRQLRRSRAQEFNDTTYVLLRTGNAAQDSRTNEDTLARDEPIQKDTPLDCPNNEPMRMDGGICCTHSNEYKYVYVELQISPPSPVFLLAHSLAKATLGLVRLDWWQRFVLHGWVYFRLFPVHGPTPRSQAGDKD